MGLSESDVEKLRGLMTEMSSLLADTDYELQVSVSCSSSEYIFSDSERDIRKLWDRFSSKFKEADSVLWPEKNR